MKNKLEILISVLNVNILKKPDKIFWNRNENYNGMLWS